MDFAQEADELVSDKESVGVISERHGTRSGNHNRADSCSDVGSDAAVMCPRPEWVGVEVGRCCAP